VTPAGFEPATYRLGICRSIRLSYGAPESRKMPHSVSFTRQTGKTRPRHRTIAAHRQCGSRNPGTRFPLNSGSGGCAPAGHRARRRGRRRRVRDGRENCPLPRPRGDGAGPYPAGAHLLELPGKLSMTREEYFIVQDIYRGWALFGFVLVGAVALNFVLTVMLHGERLHFALACLAFLLLTSTLAVFFLGASPANQATQNWTYIPDNWRALRSQWEYGHAIGAGLNFLAFCALALENVCPGGRRPAERDYPAYTLASPPPCSARWRRPGAADAGLHGRMAGVGHHQVVGLGPGLVQAVGGGDRADDVVAPLHDGRRDVADALDALSAARRLPGRRRA
jgi:hypothetical protein